MIKAMMLFGSAARGDNSKGSDVDMLAIVAKGRPYTIKRENVEMQFLSERELFSMARGGDLFAIHLAYEGRTIMDNGMLFAKFREALVLKKNYGEIRSKASDFAWFLLGFGREFENQSLINKRIAWCVRTVLISKLVEEGRFIFSPRGLALAFPAEEISGLIGLRRNDESSQNRFDMLEKFLYNFCEGRPKEDTIEKYQVLFSKTQNSVAGSTVFALKSGKNISHQHVY